MKRHTAFSLIELLAVISIVALLAAILLPVFFNTRQKSRNVTCQSNLRQIGVGLLQYVADYDGVFPPTSQNIFTRDPDNPNKLTSKQDAPDWRTLIAEHAGIKGANLLCPDVYIPPDFTFYKRNFSGYAYNSNLDDSVVLTDSRVQPIGQAETIVHYPAAFIVVFEGRINLISASNIDLDDKEKENHPKDEIYLGPEGATRHAGRSNYLFADGHVKSLNPEGIQASNGDKADGTRPSFIP